MSFNSDKEIQEIKKRYKKREDISEHLYDPTTPWMIMIEEEKEREILYLLRKKGLLPLSNKKVLEIGAGNGNNLLQFIRWGVAPENLYANELIEKRLDVIRKRLPSGINTIPGNALELNLPPAHFDLIFQSMVFSSILDDTFRKELASALWGLVKRGGAFLWYDFTYNNPWNPDIKKVELKEIFQLFPESRITARRITVAPPVARIITRIHPSLYKFISFVKILNSSLVCYIEKRQ